MTSTYASFGPIFRTCTPPPSYERAQNRGNCAISVHGVTPTSFAIFVNGGYKEFIAAGIFLMFIIINLTMLLQHCTFKIFRITVEYRKENWKREVGVNRKLALARRMDLGFSICLLICIITSSNVGSPWWSSQRMGGVVCSYFVV